MMLWQTEFPQFPHADMPPIPADWEDSSWHNDVCPSFRVMQGGDGDSNYEFSRVWIAESDPAERELPEMPRFIVSYENGESDSVDGLVSDNWADVLAYVAIRRFLGAEYTRIVGYNPFLDEPGIEPETVLENLAWHMAQRESTQ